MSFFVPIAMFGWIPLVLLLFATLPPRRAILISFLLAWLFLPVAEYEVRGIPNFAKMSATSLGVLLGIVLFDATRLSGLRLRWFDLPMLVWICVPMASSLTNGLGAYDGLSAVIDHGIVWGVPYFVGRMYFIDLLALRDLAVAVVIGGLLYIPLCLYEIRMSPQLHTMVYGFHQHVFAQSIRGGGWRPTVFMQHGLAVAMWMAMTSLLAIWLWQTRTVKNIRNIPMSILVPALVVTAVLCKSVGALALLIVGVTALSATQWTRSATIVLLLVMIAPVYLTARVAMSWDASSVVAMVYQLERDRAESLHMRLYNERRIVDITMNRPLFGWGRWGGYRNVDDDGGAVVTDSLWILALGQTGFIGLAAIGLTLLLPTMLLMNRTRCRGWHTSERAGAAGLAVVLVLFVIDSLFNSMLNPLYLLAAGGLAGLSMRALHDPGRMQ